MITSTYLPLAGGTLTGDLLFSDSAKYREKNALIYIGKMQAWLPEDMRLTDEQVYHYANDYDSVDWGDIYDYDY